MPSEVDQLRTIYRALDRIQQNIDNTRVSLQKADQKENHHLTLAQHNIADVKREIVILGKSANQKADHF